MGGLELFFRSAFRAFHALWLEITGVFFLAFALAFVGAGAREYRQLGNGGSRLEIAGAACLALLFVYFAVTAFWRARRR